MATGLAPMSSDTELAVGFVLGALQRPSWFDAACIDTSGRCSTLEPEPEPERLRTRAVYPHVLIQLMRIYAVRAASISFAGKILKTDSLVVVIYVRKDVCTFVHT